MSADLIKYTEAAIALLEGKLAEIVYLPPDVRKNKVRINASGHATSAPPSPKEQVDRIVVADPLGFLLAVMNGQPVVTFGAETKAVKPKDAGARVKSKFPQLRLGKVDGVEIIAEVHIPTLEDRKEVAKFLVPYVTEKRKKGDAPKEDEDGFDDILAARIQEVKDKENGS